MAHVGTCRDCERPIVHGKAGMPKLEGYLWHSAHGRCAACYRRHRLASVERCADCDRPMVRGKGKPPKGFVSHNAGGFCRRCYGRRMNDRLAEQITPDLTADPGLARFMEDRRKRMARRKRLSRLMREEARAA